MRLVLIIGFLVLLGCKDRPSATMLNNGEPMEAKIDEVSLVVLGTVQDAGSPHIACTRSCCAELFGKPDPRRKVVSLGIIDTENDQKFLFEATPDLPSQLKALAQLAPSSKEMPDGIFLTHAHIGHYSGLMYLGKEAVNSNGVPVYVMPRMHSYLESNGPWGQLVHLNNIALKPMKDSEAITLTSNVTVIPFRVPHRDEFSETVGYKIIGPEKTVLFIPDIDKWEQWDVGIVQAISEVDYAFLDATFYDGIEIDSRDISEIPHPFVIESMELFKDLPSTEKSKIHFIHFNHTNPLLNRESKAYKKVVDNGFKVAAYYDLLSL